jgi:hypothetical protein
VITRVQPVFAEPLESRLLFAYTRFAVIGDFSAGQPLADVSNLIKSWHPNFIATVGDNNYNVGAAATIDTNIGQYFSSYISPYAGGYGTGSIAGNRFWPALGNHDYGTPNAQPYLNYFQLPGNERYYNVLQGNTELFIINSNPEEPDGTSASSIQAKWLKGKLAESTAQWKIVLFHHAAYSSSADHGSQPYMQWPFQQWGATAVIAGHDHDYERIIRNGFPYFVNGLGGRSLYTFGTPISGSQVRYSSDYGAMRVDAHDEAITFRFFNRAGVQIDAYTINADKTNKVQLIRAGDTWKYFDGQMVDSTWRNMSFNDSAWSSGPAQLGYGDGDESTVLSFGPNAAAKYITSYFRKSFTVPDPAAITSINLQIMRDDGAVIYLNGTELLRTNFTSGAYTSSTIAASAVEDNDFYSFAIAPSRLVSGNNVITVEVHQNIGNSSDLSFDLMLTGTLGTTTPPPAAPSALRATAVSASQINLAWIDTVTNETGFEIERSINGATYTQIATVAAGTQAFNNTGLTPNQKYWYRVRAINAGGFSGWSGPATATTPLTRPAQSIRALAQV